MNSIKNLFLVKRVPCPELSDAINGKSSIKAFMLQMLMHSVDKVSQMNQHEHNNLLFAEHTFMYIVCMYQGGAGGAFSSVARMKIDFGAGRRLNPWGEAK